MRRVKGLTDPEHVDLTRAAPIGIVLAKGDVKPEKGAGRNLPYFRPKYQKGFERYQEIFEALVGNEPAAIKGVRFPGPAMAVYTDRMQQKTPQTGVILQECDGETISRVWTGENYDRTPQPCQRPDCDCKYLGRLLFYLPELVKRTGIFFFIALYTGSPNEGQHIAAQLDMAERFTDDLTALTFVLFRRPETFDTVINGKPAKVTQHMVYLSGNLADVLLPAGDAVPTLPDVSDAMEGPAALETGQTSVGGYTFNTYTDYWRTMVFPTHLEFSVEDFLAEIGLNEDEFIHHNPTRSDGNYQLAKYVADNSLPVHVNEVQVSQLKTGKNAYHFDVGFATITSYERKPFVEAKVIQPLDWSESGRTYPLMAGVMVFPKLAKNGEYIVDRVEIEIPF